MNTSQSHISHTSGRYVKAGTDSNNVEFMKHSIVEDDACSSELLDGSFIDINYIDIGPIELFIVILL